MVSFTTVLFILVENLPLTLAKQALDGGGEGRHSSSRCFEKYIKLLHVSRIEPQLLRRQAASSVNMPTKTSPFRTIVEE